MKKTIQTLLTLLCLLALSACYRNDIRTETFQIEQLRSPQATQLIEVQINQLTGIKNIEPDYENKTLTVEFNGSVIYLKNIEFAIVKAGFSLPNWPATPADLAKLPKELQ